MPGRFILPHDEYKALTRKVAQRDAQACRCCGSRKGLSVHHIIFRSDGGGDFSSNLVTLCGGSRGCHDAVHGKVKDRFVVILNPKGEDILPDANYSLKFKVYPSVRRRKTWKFPK